jgi:hypothetical protein
VQKASIAAASSARAPGERGRVAHHTPAPIPADDPEEQAAAQQPQVGLVATRPEVTDLRAALEHARLAEVEVQQRAIEVAAQAGDHPGRAVVLRAQCPHPAIRDDRDEEDGDGGEEQPADGKAEQAATLGAAV